GQARPWPEPLARASGADSVRGGVMNMKQIEILFLTNCRHLRRECQCVGLMLKQRIRHHLNFVKAYVLVEFCQPCGQRRGDEVNSVAACSEFLTEFGSNNAAT